MCRHLIYKIYDLYMLYTSHLTVKVRGLRLLEKAGYDITVKSEKQQQKINKKGRKMWKDWPYAFQPFSPFPIWLHTRPT